jgi:selenocysteine lyase/cysteine desulfurase
MLVEEGHGQASADDDQRLAELRAQFPVLSRLAYLNAAMHGPVPRVAKLAAQAELDQQLETGRGLAYHERRHELGEKLRERLAELVKADPAEIALTSSTTDGISRVLLEVISE